jgi:hypothetical protein
MNFNSRQEKMKWFLTADFRKELADLEKKHQEEIANVLKANESNIKK